MKIDKKSLLNGAADTRTEKVMFAYRIGGNINILLEEDRPGGEVRRDGLRGTNYICSLRSYSVIPVKE